MKVIKEFAPITLVIETAEEKVILLNMLNAAYREYEKYRDPDMMQRISHLQQQILK